MKNEIRRHLILGPAADPCALTAACDELKEALMQQGCNRWDIGYRISAVMDNFEPLIRIDAIGTIEQEDKNNE